MGLLLCARPPCLFVCLDVAKLSKGRGGTTSSPFSCLLVNSRRVAGRLRGPFFRFSFPVLSFTLIEKGRRRRRIKDKAETKKRSCPRLRAYVYFLLSCFLLFSFWTLIRKKCLRRGVAGGAFLSQSFFPVSLSMRKRMRGRKEKWRVRARDRERERRRERMRE